MVARGFVSLENRMVDDFSQVNNRLDKIETRLDSVEQRLDSMVKFFPCLTL
jgi:tetrahydromethanopterin S-methyltransferase subunit G